MAGPAALGQVRSPAPHEPTTAERMATASRQVAASMPLWKVAVIGAVAAVIISLIMVPILWILSLVAKISGTVQAILDIFKNDEDGDGEGDGLFGWKNIGRKD